MQLGSGYIKFRNRKLHILWTGQFAQHVAENHIKNKYLYPYLHVEIQQSLKILKEFNRNGKRYIAIKEESNGCLFIVFQIRTIFAEIVTSYFNKTTAEMAKKRKGISGHLQIRDVDLRSDKEFVAEIEKDGYLDLDLLQYQVLVAFNPKVKKGELKKYFMEKYK